MHSKLSRELIKWIEIDWSDPSGHTTQIERTYFWTSYALKFTSSDQGGIIILKSRETGTVIWRYIACNFIKKVFSCNFCKSLKLFYTEHFGTPAFGEHFSLFCLFFPRLPQHKAEYHFSSFSASLVKKITEVKKKSFL